MLMFLALSREAKAKHGCAARESEQGHVTVLMVIMAPILIFGFVGLLWDGGQAVNRRAEVEDVAFGAARAAAAQTESNANGVVIDPAAAQAAAAAYIDRFDNITGSVSVTDDSVTVSTIGTYEPEFLGAVGVSSWTFDATHTAEKQVGVAADDDT